MGRQLLSPFAAISPRSGAYSDSGEGPETLIERILAPWSTWCERLRTAACCREILRLDRIVARGQPELANDDRYRKVVCAHTGSDPAAAKAVLDCARASFACWPVSRPLTLRDVAHYLAVSDILAARGGTGWVHANLKRVVDSSIPPGL
jgi:hypothetical protein